MAGNAKANACPELIVPVADKITVTKVTAAPAIVHQAAGRTRGQGGVLLGCCRIDSLSTSLVSRSTTALPHYALGSFLGAATGSWWLATEKTQCTEQGRPYS